MNDRPQSLAEEIANSVSHGLGFLAALAAAPVAIVYAVRKGNAATIVGASVYAAAMILLYLASCLYHAMPQGWRRGPWAKALWAKLDHSAIYVFIAGSYTPFALGALHGPWGWTLFGLIWSLALVGILLKAFDRLRHPLLSTGLYLAMGWLVLIAAVPLLEKVSAAGIAWLVAGGLAYTVGVVFFLTDARIRFGHFIWHLFVMAGSTCHFFAVLWYAAGPAHT